MNPPATSSHSRKPYSFLEKAFKNLAAHSATNVWQYKGVNTLKAGRLDELSLHPTAKPVAMIADAIKDVSKRNGIVLDPFGGSGSTLIAAHKTADGDMSPNSIRSTSIIIRCWQAYAKDDAILCRAVRLSTPFRTGEKKRASGSA